MFRPLLVIFRQHIYSKKLYCTVQLSLILHRWVVINAPYFRPVFLYRHLVATSQKTHCGLKYKSLSINIIWQTNLCLFREPCIIYYHVYV
jgi:hypothetical protein